MSASWDEKVAALAAWRSRHDVVLEFGPGMHGVLELYGMEHHCGSLVGLPDPGELAFCGGCRQDVPQRRELTDDEAKPLYAIKSE